MAEGRQVCAGTGGWCRWARWCKLAFFLRLWLTSAAAVLNPTTHTLLHDNVPEHTVAKFKNLLIHNEKVIYAYDGGQAPKLPRLWQHHAWYGNPGPFLDITLMPVDEARALVGNSRVQTERVASLAWRPWTENLYHSVTESVFTVYQHGCTYFGLCSHARLSSMFTVVFHDNVHAGNPLVEFEKSLPAAAQAMACYAKQYIEIHAPRWANQTLVLLEAVTGIGPHDRAYGHDARHYEVFTAPPKHISHGFRATMATCMGIPYMRPGRRKPYKVTLLNRSTLGGRHMLNADTMVRNINAMPGFQATLEYVDGRTMRDQYLWASQSDIIIYVHGAIMGNFAWLSPDAVVIEYAFTWDDSHRHGFAMQILDDMSLNASFIGTGSKSRNAVIPKLEYFLGRKEFQQMTAQQKVEMLERRECIPAYKGPCSHMGQFMVQADWQVLQTAVELASQLVEAKEHRLIILDRDRGFRLLQHPHPEDGARRPVDFLDHQNPLRPAT